jgi:hypothetical protein
MCPRHWRLAQRLEHLFDIQEIMSSILIVPTICVVRAFGFRPRYNTPSLHNCGEERGVLWHAYRLASGECWPIIRSSSSGLGILTFNQEDAGSNPAGRTICSLRITASTPLLHIGSGSSILSVSTRFREGWSFESAHSLRAVIVKVAFFPLAFLVKWYHESVVTIHRQSDSDRKHHARLVERNTHGAQNAAQRCISVRI